ncbi:hypothetical protein HMI54_011252 [Coelomomyces lativittatus]|nr:hypothetical protein HMI54_011252 [Coelomomyces lativittatus]
MWDKYGHLLHELYGHTSFVYKVTSNLVSEELVSCGEDRTVRIWKDATLHQTLTLPVISVWSVAVSPNGLELAAAGSDGHVYVFTRTPSNVADAELQNQYTLSLSQFAIPKNQIGDLKKDTLPGPEALLSPGNKEGQVIMIQTSSSVEAHQWSMAQLKWIKIGDVVDAIGNSRKQLHEGIEYDYVFDIDTGSGKFLKLPYNLKGLCLSVCDI